MDAMSKVTCALLGRCCPFPHQGQQVIPMIPFSAFSGLRSIADTAAWILQALRQTANCEVCSWLGAFWAVGTFLHGESVTLTIWHAEIDGKIDASFLASS